MSTSADPQPLHILTPQAGYVPTKIDLMTVSLMVLPDLQKDWYY